MVQPVQPVALLVDNSFEESLLFRLSMKKAGVDLDLIVLPNAQRFRDYIEGKNVYSDRFIFPLPAVIFLAAQVDYEPSTVLQNWLHERDEGYDVPIIVLSVSLDPKIFENAKTCGATACFEKPVSRENWNVVRSLLSERHLCA
ncbi:MAG TPA: hypothetical protein VMZ27_18135 [Candidatus Saccharimonadales bacterium]|nr:hypothetical protein [Candidatus Saccharimonadales bacterium]